MPDSACETRKTPATATYFSLAWVGVVVACYSGYLGATPPRLSEAQAYVVFLCGALFALGGVLSHHFDLTSSRVRMVAYFAVQSALVTVALFNSGLHGSFGILPLPLVSNAVLVLPWRGIAAVSIALFGATIGAYGASRGLDAAIDSALPYGSAFIFTLVLSIAGRHAFAARTEAERLSQELSEANSRLREQADRAEELATTRERNRLAREIHDGVGHYLTVIKVQLDAAAATFASQPQTAQHSIATAARLAGEALDDVRRSVGALRSDAPRPPLHATLQELATQCQPAAQVTCDGRPRPLDPAMEHALFRAAQEGLTNVRKHARASSVSVHVDYLPDRRVRIEIADDGVGPGGGANGAHAGFGLTGLRERFALLGGTVELRARTPRGCSLVAEVPA